MLVLSAVLCAAAMVVSACAPAAAPAPPLTPVTVQLAWTHQAQFAGLYAADQNGYFAEEGIAVSFLAGGSQVDILTPVVEGAAQFGVASGDELILARAAGMPLQAVATIYRRSPVVFISLAEKGITQPQDFVGLTIRAPSNTLPSLRSMMAQIGVADDQYEIVELPSDLALFESGEVPVWGVFFNAFVVTVQQAGHAINMVFPDDYGVHFYADTLFTTDALIAEDPDLVLRFVRAALKGWTYAIENPAKMARMVQKYNPNADLAIEDARMIASLPLVNTGEGYIGWMRDDRWVGMAQTLRDHGMLTHTVDVANVYTMQFLREIYD